MTPYQPVPTTERAYALPTEPDLAELVLDFRRGCDI